MSDRRNETAREQRLSRRELGFGLAAGALFGAREAMAGDWSQWRGPQRNGISSEAVAPWGGGGPRKLWNKNVGQGWSAVTVAGNRAYTMGNSNGKDVVHCLNVDNGQSVWGYSYNQNSGEYGGPRATPVLNANRLYTMSREGIVLCLDAANGKLVWWKDLAREIRSEVPRWSFAGSPLVEGNLVIYNLGTNGVALDKGTGKIVWKSGTQAPGYASPVAAAIGGTRQVLIFAADGLVSVVPATGKILWKFPWSTQYGVNAADPIVSGDQVFISSGYNTGCALLKVSGNRANAVWQNRNMKNHFNSSVLSGGALFGNDENTLRCLDWNSGAVKWSSRGIGKGGMIVAGGNLIVLTERGELVLVKADSTSYQELGRAQVLRGTCWTHPTLANGRLYCRSHEGDLVCLQAGRA